jgi:type IX secretion system PorP/SprF family membrane protein
MDLFKQIIKMKALQMKKIVFVAAVVFFTVQLNAQQDPQYTQYLYNMNVVNPAYAGSYDALAINLLGRTQWVGIDGAPETLTFNIHAPVGKNLGLGFSAIADKIGPLTEQNVYADFSYTLQLGEVTNLAFGVKAGFSNINAPLSLLETTNPGDPSFDNNLNRTNPNFGLGVFYYKERFFAGLSMPNILKTVHFERSNGAITRATDEMHIFFTSGYVFDLSDDIKLKPSTMIKAVQGAPLSIDLSGNLLFNDNFELGLSYRLDDSFSALVNVRATRNLRIGYAYDYTLSNLGDFNTGSHELFVLFDFIFSRNSLKSPRFF